MTIFDNVFPLGLGTNRLPIAGVNDEAGIDYSARLIAAAIGSGVNYIDVAHTYSRGMAAEALRRAFKLSGAMDGVTIKSRLDMDKRADDVRTRADDVLQNLGLSSCKYFCFWSITSYAEFEAMMARGGSYEGAVRLKDDGIVEHICLSTHAPIDDIVRILKSDAFEAVTISFSLLNALRYGEVLQTAREHNIGVAVMNPLGGGIIPNNADYFVFARNREDKSVPEAALRYVLAHKDIQIALTGVSSFGELNQNIQSVTSKTSESDVNRIKRVNAHVKTLEHFCTGCRYCFGCPAGIPTAEIMQCRNYIIFGSRDKNYAFASETVQENIFALGKLEQEHSILFETAENPCLQCGECERKCTQRLKITDAVADTYERAEYSGFSRQARMKRLNQLIDNSPDNTVGFYPGGIMTHAILRFYRENIGEPKFKVALFDSNPALWGTSEGLHEIYSPDNIAEMKPSIVIVTSYKFKNEIYDAIKHYEAKGIRVEKLSRDNELPWLL
jgi:predicted aldo/keto reductase-like oxidoreductase